MSLNETVAALKSDSELDELRLRILKDLEEFDAYCADFDAKIMSKELVRFRSSFDLDSD